MNDFTEPEANAALELRAHAHILAIGYTKDPKAPQDLEAARLALLMVACQQEAQAQGMVTKVIFDNQEE